VRAPDRPGSYRLSFLLPNGVTADRGDFAKVPGCVLMVGRSHVQIFAPSKEKAFAQATGVLREACQGRGPFSIAALLVSPTPVSGADGWTIIVGADIAFAPTSLGATFPVEIRRAAAAAVQGA
jgi:hypothetical protein